MELCLLSCGCLKFSSKANSSHDASGSCRLPPQGLQGWRLRTVATVATMATWSQRALVSRSERNKFSATEKEATEATHPETSACGISSAAAHFADGPSSAASSAAAAASALTAGLASCGHELPWCAASLTDVWSVLWICAKLADFSSQLVYQ